MKVNAFTPLFQPVTPISKVKFKKSDTGAGPEAPKQDSLYVVHLSKIYFYDFECQASSRAEAERKATAYIRGYEQALNARARCERWQIDDVKTPDGTRVRSHL